MTKLTDLTKILAVAPDNSDLIHVVDVSDTSESTAGSSKKTTTQNFFGNLARNGANSDITSLSGLTTPLSVGQGGTNNATALNNDRLMASKSDQIGESNIETDGTNIDMNAGKTIYGVGTDATHTIIEYNNASAVNPTLKATHNIANVTNSNGLHWEVTAASEGAASHLESHAAAAFRYLSTRNSLYSVQDYIGYMSNGTLDTGTVKLWAKQYDSTTSNLKFQTVTTTAITDVFALDFTSKYGDFYVGMKSDIINEHTSGAGVTVDGVLIKDGIAYSGTQYTKTVTVDPTLGSGDYQTIQAALTANAVANLLVLVYPGTYTSDTISATALNQTIRGMGEVYLDNTTQTITCNYDGCNISNITIAHTATNGVHFCSGTGDITLDNVTVNKTLNGSTAAIDYMFYNYTGDCTIIESEFNVTDTSTATENRYFFYSGAINLKIVDSSYTHAITGADCTHRLFTINGVTDIVTYDIRDNKFLVQSTSNEINPTIIYSPSTVECKFWFTQNQFDFLTENTSTDIQFFRFDDGLSTIHSSHNRYYAETISTDTRFISKLGVGNTFSSNFDQTSASAESTSISGTFNIVSSRDAGELTLDKVNTDEIVEKTSASGVTIEGNLLKDGGVTLGTGSAVNEIVTTISSPTNAQLATASSIERYVKYKSVTTVNAATYDLLVTDDILHVTYTSTGAVTSLTLPTAQMISGRVIHIKDAGDNASVNNITIDTEGAELIEGAATLVHSKDNATISLYTEGTGWHIL